MKLIFFLIIFVFFILLIYPVYADVFQDISSFFTSIFNSIISFFNSISSVLFPKPAPIGGTGGGSGGSPTGCSASMSLSISGKDTCSITASITTQRCDKKSYSIKDNGNTKCSGTIVGNSTTIKCDWTVTSGSYNYKLYVDDNYKTSRSVTCSKSPPPTCSDGTEYGSCSSNKPLYCDDGNLINACGEPYNCGCDTGECQPDGTCLITCSCSNWQNIDCGGGTCASNQMYQTRSCNPSACYTEKRCQADESCKPVSDCDSQCQLQGYDSGVCRESSSEQLFGTFISWYQYKPKNRGGSDWITQFVLEDLASYGCGILWLSLDRADWNENQVLEATGLRYQDNIAMLVDEGTKLGMRMVVSLFTDNELEDLWGRGSQLLPYDRAVIIMDPVLREGWIQWGVDVINHCKNYGSSPWGIYIMDEPGGYYSTVPLTQQYYTNNFVIPSKEAYRAVDPNIAILLMGGGGTSTAQKGNRYLDYYFDNPLRVERGGPYSDIYYIRIGDYRQYTQGDAYASNFASSGRAYARQQLYNSLESAYGPLTPYVIGAVGTRSEDSYWREFMEDLYDWYKANAAGYVQWTVTSSSNWSIYDKNGLTTIGQHWADNLPTLDGGCQPEETDKGQDGCSSAQTCCCSGAPAEGLGYEMSGVNMPNTGGDWASWFDETHLNIFRDAGGKTIRFHINWYRWMNPDPDPESNPVSSNYRDYIKQLCDWSREKGLRSVIGLFSSRGWSTDWEQKYAVITNRNYTTGQPASVDPVYMDAFGEERNDPQTDWINWGKEIIAYCNPDGIDMMSEHTSSVDFDEWRDFCIRSITEYRSVKPTIHCYVEGYRSKRSDGNPDIDYTGDNYLGGWPARLDDFMINPLPFDNITYELHRYWTSTATTSYSLPFSSDYKNGRLAEGRETLFDYFDWIYKVGDHFDRSVGGRYDVNTLWPNVAVGEYGAYNRDFLPGSIGANAPTNWDIIMQNFYDWCKSRDIHFLQWGFSESWPMLISDETALNSAGQLWADNLP